MKKIRTFLLASTVIFFTACGGGASSLKPLVGDCCNNGAQKKVSKNIYIGHFVLTDKKNIDGIFGKCEESGGNIEEVKFKETLDLIVREEMLRRLSTVSDNVKLVDAKPDNFKEGTDIYIDGHIDRAWINQKFPSSAVSTFNYTNTYELSIKSMINNKPILDNFTGKLHLKLLDYSNENNLAIMNAINLYSLIFGGFHISGDGGSEVGKTIDHKLYINDNLLADFIYFQYIDIGITNDYKVAIKGKVYGKNKQVLDDAASGGGRVYDNVYAPFSLNNNTATVSNFINDFNDGDSYLTKQQIKAGSSSRNLDNTKYYDVFRLYTTTSGILQYMINEHIDNIIDEIN